MSVPEPLASPADTRAEIMRATYLALCEHGYADLTIQRIGDEFAKSKSLLYHHYDGKDELLLDFLSFVLERFEAGVDAEPHEDARDCLSAVFDHVLGPEEEDRDDFRRAMVELRAQAAHDPAYREHFTEHDRVLRDSLVELIEAGIEGGSFAGIDARRVADHLHTVLVGAMTRESTAADVDAEALRAELDAYVEARLLGEG